MAVPAPRAAPSGDSGLKSWCDADARLIHVVGHGFWSPSEAKAHFAELRQLVGTMRGAVGKVRVLVDLREAPVQTGDVGDRIREGTADIYTTEDRIAVVMSS
jgi:hypothetical protein